MDEREKMLQSDDFIKYDISLQKHHTICPETHSVITIQAVFCVPDWWVGLDASRPNGLVDYYPWPHELAEKPPLFILDLTYYDPRVVSESHNLTLEILEFGIALGGGWGGEPSVPSIDPEKTYHDLLARAEKLHVEKLRHLWVPRCDVEGRSELDVRVGEHIRKLSN